MPLLVFIAVLIALGVLLWALNTYIASMIDPLVMRIINIVAVFAIIVWVLSVFGVLDPLLGVQVPRV